MNASSPHGVEILQGDTRAVLKTLAAGSVNTCVTSPPYFGLRDYGVDGQIGLEQTPEAFVAELVGVFREVRRVLRDDGTLWLNLGDSYSRSPAKGGSGPGGKNENRWGYGAAQSAKTGSSDGAVGRGDRPGSRSGGLGEKQLLGIPWRVAFALQADGWYLRQDIIWHKPNPMPESVRDRCTKAHEYIFLLSKNERYFFDSEAIKEPLARPEEAKRKTPARFGGADKHAEAGKQSRLHSGNEYVGTSDGKRNRRDVWTVSLKPFKEAHFATFPPDLIEPCVLAGAPPGGVVLDPFFGAGTTGLVAQKHGRRCIGIELNPAYVEIAKKRLGLSALKGDVFA